MADFNLGHWGRFAWKVSKVHKTYSVTNSDVYGYTDRTTDWSVAFWCKSV